MGLCELSSFWNFLGSSKAHAMKLYTLVKCLHLMAVLVWMAGMFRLVHFFSEASESARTEEIDSLLDFDGSWTSPAMLSAWVLGSWMVWRVRWWTHSWFAVKFLLALAVSGLHGVLVGRAKRLANDSNTLPKPRYKGLPIALLAVVFTIIVMVIAKPI